MRDTPQDILKTLKSRYADEKDLRVLAKDILAAHALVESVNFGSVVLAVRSQQRLPDLVFGYDSIDVVGQPIDLVASPDREPWGKIPDLLTPYPGAVPIPAGEIVVPAGNLAEGYTHVVDRELYVVALDGNGVMAVNGALSGIIGKPMLTRKDVNGKEFNREMVEIKDQGWVRFTWRNPLTNAMQLKAQYMVRVDEYVVGVGAYVDKPTE